MLRKVKAGLAGLTVVGFSSFAGIGADAAAKVTEAGTEAELVYVAVITVCAAYFVVKLIRRAL